jgi:DNA mismatch repair protein MutS
MGSRCLQHALHHPLRDPAIPSARHAAVETLLDDAGQAMHAVRDALKGMADIERITGRIALQSARPRDLSGLCTASASARCAACAAARRQRTAAAGTAPATGNPRRRARAADPRHRPGTFANLRDGGVIANGYDADLDELRGIRTTAATSSSRWKRANASAPASAA